MDQFDAYFKRADLDGDGRISGAEAVAFFQGSNLSKQVLAQIWMHADQRQTGFLGRQEFYNALRLVTVAQSKRDLTPEIVKAALYGPAAAKIPPPQINLPPKPAPSVASAGQIAAPSLPPSQAPNATQNQQFFPPQHAQPARPPQSLPLAPSVRPPQPHSVGAFPRGGGMMAPVVPNANVSNNWAGGGMSGGLQIGPGGMNQALAGPVRPQSPVTLPSQTMVGDSKALVVSGNGPASTSGLGNNLLSAGPSQAKPEISVTSINNVAAIPPVSGGLQTSDKPNPLDSLSSFLRGPSSSQPTQPQTSVRPNLPVSSQVGAPILSAATGNSNSENNQIQWPKMKAGDVQKYTKVFVEVDTDRDGKVTGEQARSLFLSWRLPREILKQVWDLSDQDNDSMLSLREFCFALYLMERYREGRPLPAALPGNVMYDETLLAMTGPPKVSYGNAALGHAPGPGFGPQQGIPGARPMAPVTGPRPPRPPMHFPQADGTMMPGQRDLSAPVLGDSFFNQTDAGDQSYSQDATDTEKKVEEKIILDSKEKLEFYRTKMQDLVLYKSRCDNKLNEITERAIADKREAELLAKKYEEKYKQVSEIASKLTVEEATFRDVQERKMELQQAIINIEQGGSADGILQVRADRIQSDLDELMKGLVDRCTKLSIDVKPAALIVLPAGWQPGIPEKAAVWDEEWDKFEDEGFSNEVSFDGKANSTPGQRDAASPGGVSPNGQQYSPFSGVEQAFDSESMYNHSEDGSGRSPHGSPPGRTTPESSFQSFSDPHFEKSSEGDAETHRSFDDSNWGAFDNNDDVDSVWGFNAKDSTSYSFGDSDFGVKPIKTDSPTSNTNAFQKRSTFFEDSVPPTPASKFDSSSPRYSEAGDSYFDNFSRFDSFRSTSDTGGFFSSSSSQPDRLTRFDSMSSSKDYPQPDRLTRFDSMSSSKDFGSHSRGFASFDDSDPFGSTGPFKVTSETPKKSPDNWNAF